jgi:hypothetical protein
MKNPLTLILGLIAIGAIITAAIFYQAAQNTTRDTATDTPTSSTLATTQPSPLPTTLTSPTTSDKANLIRVTSPTSNALVTSPLQVTGEARGTWYFEASFSVRLLDGNGVELSRTGAEAQQEWMTEAFVPFKATLTFTKPTTTTGTLVLEKANPSGLPEKDDSLQIPVRFK